MLSKMLYILSVIAILAGVSSAIDFPPDPPSGTIELNYDSSSSSYYLSLNIPIEANSFGDTSGTATIGDSATCPSAYTTYDMFFNYTGDWTLWVVPTAYGGHVVEEPLTAVYVFRTLPAPQACGAVGIQAINNLGPSDYDIYNDCGNGGYPVFHNVAYDFEVSLNQPIQIHGA